MAMRISVGFFIMVYGIAWVVTKAAPINFAPIVPVSNRAFAAFPLMSIMPSSLWCALIIVGRVVFSAA